MSILVEPPPGLDAAHLGAFRALQSESSKDGFHVRLFALLRVAGRPDSPLDTATLEDIVDKLRPSLLFACRPRIPSSLVPQVFDYPTGAAEQRVAAAYTWKWFDMRIKWLDAETQNRHAHFPLPVACLKDCNLHRYRYLVSLSSIWHLSAGFAHSLDAPIPTKRAKKNFDCFDCASMGGPESPYDANDFFDYRGGGAV